MNQKVKFLSLMLIIMQTIINVFSASPISIVSNLGGDIYAAYSMMLETVSEYLDNSNYFTIELKDKLVDYEYKQINGNEKKMSWKHFFLDTYAIE